MGDFKAQSNVSVKRRKPVQLRAHLTAEAIQQAFVELLVEKGYAQISIRQIIALAGVSTGSFYEYYASKEALAAVCVHLSVKKISIEMRKCVAAMHDEPLPIRVDSLLRVQTREPLSKPEHWSALFLLDRQVSAIEPFRQLYASFVRVWEDMLDSGPGWSPGVDTAESAFAIHSIAYGMVSQALLTGTLSHEPAAIERVLRKAVHGYLSVRAPHAYRFYEFDPAITVR